MSVTFSCFEAPSIVSAKYECLPCSEHSPSINCTECNNTGFVRFYGSPYELNLSNSTAHALLANLGLRDPKDDSHPCGTWSPQQCEEIRRMIAVDKHELRLRGGVTQFPPELYQRLHDLVRLGYNNDWEVSYG